MNELPAYMLVNLKKVSTKRVAMVSCCFFLSFTFEGCFFFSNVGCCFKKNKYERKFKEYEMCWLLSHHDICLCREYAIECIGSIFVESTTHSELFFIFLFVWTIWGRIQVSNIQNYAAHLLMSSKKITRLLVSLLLYHVNFTCWNKRTVLRCPFSIAHTYRWSSVQSVSIHWPNHLLNLLYSRKKWSFVKDVGDGIVLSVYSNNWSKKRVPHHSCWTVSRWLNQLEKVLIVACVCVFCDFDIGIISGGKLFSARIKKHLIITWINK